MANPANNKEKIIADVKSGLEANAERKGAWPVASDDDAFSDLRVIYKVEEYTVEVVTAVLLSPGHPDRAAFLEDSAELEYQDIIPAHIGNTGACFVKQATSGSFIQAEPDSYFSIDFQHGRGITVDAKKPHYHITSDDVLYFTGDSNARAIIRIASIDLTDVADVAFYATLPVDLFGLIAYGALMDLFPRGGDFLDYAEAYEKRWNNGVARIAKGDSPADFAVFHRRM